MAVEVRLPTVLRSHAGGASVVTLDGATADAALASQTVQKNQLRSKIAAFFGIGTLKGSRTPREP